MKIVRRGALPVGGERVDGGSRPRDRQRGSDPRGGQPQRAQHYDIWPAYVERVLSFVDVGAIRALRVVIDAANGMAGVMLPPVSSTSRSTRARTTPPDGSFRTTSRTLCSPRTASSSSRRRSGGADLGVAFDGDADRCFFVDDTGEFVPGDFVTALLAESILAKHPGAKIIYDVRASWAVPETIERAGGVPLINRVGHAFIKHRMRKDEAVFRGEVSGHYYFPDFSQADSGSSRSCSCSS